LAGKIYFGKNRRWFGKLGLQYNYTLRHGHLDIINANRTSNLLTLDTPGSRPRSWLSPFIGVGYNLPLKNGGALKLEMNMHFDARQHSKNPNFKIGYRF